MSAIWSNGINCSIHRCTIKWNTSEMCHTNDQYVTKIYPTQCDNVYNAMNHYMITRDQNKTHCYCEQVLWYARCYRTQTPTNTFTWCPWNFIYTIRRSDYVCECTRLLLCLICQCYSWINIFNSICLLKMKWKKTHSLEPVLLHNSYTMQMLHTFCSFYLISEVKEEHFDCIVHSSLL